MRTPSPAKVGSANYFPKGNQDDGTGVYITRRRRENPPEYYHASTPDPWNKLFRLFWLFITSSTRLLLLFITGGLIAALYCLGG